MPKSYFQSTGQFMACNESYTIVNQICYLIDIGISSNLFLALDKLVDAGMPW